MSRRLDGKVALISGTGGGLGSAAATRFAEEGAVVVGCDLDKDSSQRTIDQVRAAGHEMTALAPTDLSDPDAADEWVKAAIDAHGRIDILYNNASAARFGSLEQLSTEDWRFTVRNEVDLVFYSTRAAWPYLSRAGGVVINVASVAAHRGTRATSQVPHSSTKGAVLAMTRQLAVEGAPHGVRVVSISPGAIETPGTAEILADPGVREHLLSQQLVPRIGQPVDVAGVAVFLASDEASFITGTDVLVDGGLTAF